MSTPTETKGRAGLTRTAGRSAMNGCGACESRTLDMSEKMFVYRYHISDWKNSEVLF